MQFNGTDVIAKLDGPGALRFQDSLDQEQLGVYENEGVILGYRGSEQFKTVDGGVEIIGTASGTAVETTLTDDDTKLATSGGVFAHLASLRFTSSDLTITPGGLLTIAHGLTTKPKHITLWVKCTDAGGDAGYDQNDEVMISTANDSSASARAMPVWRDATNIYVRFNTSSDTIYIGAKNNGGITAIDETKWALIVEASI